jgi:hypothetical protein
MEGFGAPKGLISFGFISGNKSRASRQFHFTYRSQFEIEAWGQVELAGDNEIKMRPSTRLVFLLIRRMIYQ